MQCVCGGYLIMDAEMRYAICEYCSLKYDRQSIVQNVKVGGILGYDELVKNAETYLLFPDLNKATEIFIEITNKYPDKWRGWWGLIETRTHNFKNINFTNCEMEINTLNYINNYYKRATMSIYVTTEDKEYMKLKINAYKQSIIINKQINNEIKEYNDKINAATEQSQTLKEKIDYLQKKLLNIQTQRNKFHNNLAKGSFVSIILILLIITCTIITVVTGLVFYYNGENDYLLLIFFGAIIINGFTIVTAIGHVFNKKDQKKRLRHTDNEIDNIYDLISNCKIRYQEIDAKIMQTQCKLNEVYV